MYGSCCKNFTTALDLRRDASSTGIFSLCRVGIKYIWRYSSFVLVSASATLTWPWVWSQVSNVSLALWNIFQNYTLLLVPSKLFFGHLQGSSQDFSFMELAHATLVNQDIYGSTISHLNNFWYRELKTYYFQDLVIWALRSVNVERSVAKVSYPHYPWLAWEPLLPTNADLSWA